jgi:O-antigen/teichoic acid export membrane protein
LGSLSFTGVGLIIARIAGFAGSSLMLLKKSVREVNFLSSGELKSVAFKYRDYPLYGMVPAFLDIASVQGLVLIISRFYSTSDLGFFGLTNLVLSAPLGLIGGSFKDVFYQKTASLIGAHRYSSALSIFKRSAFLLSTIGLVLCAILYFFGTDIFRFVFGEGWTRSGEFASLMGISFWIQLTVSPLSSVFNAANRVKIASMWQTLYFVSTFSTLGFCALILQLKIDMLVIVYVVHEVILYTLYFGLQYYTLKKLCVAYQES